MRKGGVRKTRGPAGQSVPRSVGWSQGGLEAARAEASAAAEVASAEGAAARELEVALKDARRGLSVARQALEGRVEEKRRLEVKRLQEELSRERSASQTSGPFWHDGAFGPPKPFVHSSAACAGRGVSSRFAPEPCAAWEGSSGLRWRRRKEHSRARRLPARSQVDYPACCLPLPLLPLPISFPFSAPPLHSPSCSPSAGRHLPLRLPPSPTRVNVHPQGQGTKGFESGLALPEARRLLNETDRCRRCNELP